MIFVCVLQCFRFVNISRSCEHQKDLAIIQSIIQPIIQSTSHHFRACSVVHMAQDMTALASNIPVGGSDAAAPNGIWVGNIPLGTSEEDAIDDFERSGLPKPCKILVRKGDRKNVSYGLAYYDNRHDMNTVLAAPESSLMWWNGKHAVVRRDSTFSSSEGGGVSAGGCAGNGCLSDEVVGG